MSNEEGSFFIFQLVHKSEDIVSVMILNFKYFTCFK